MSLGCAGGEVELDCKHQGWRLEGIVRGLAGGCGADAGGGGGVLMRGVGKLGLGGWGVWVRRRGTVDQGGEDTDSTPSHHEQLRHALPLGPSQGAVLLLFRND